MATPECGGSGLCQWPATVDLVFRSHSHSRPSVVSNRIRHGPHLHAWTAPGLACVATVSAGGHRALNRPLNPSQSRSEQIQVAEQAPLLWWEQLRDRDHDRLGSVIV